MQLEEYRRVNRELKEDNEILNKELNEVMAEATDIENKYYELQDKYKRLNIFINETINYIKEHCIDDEFYINLNEKEKGIVDVLTMLENGVDKE